MLTNFDTDLGGAVAKVINAKILGAIDDDNILRRVLKESGEFARYDEAAKDTPEDEEVLYPPIQVSADSLAPPRRVIHASWRLATKPNAAPSSALRGRGTRSSRRGVSHEDAERH